MEEIELSMERLLVIGPAQMFKQLPACFKEYSSQLEGVDVSYDEISA